PPARGRRARPRRDHGGRGLLGGLHPPRAARRGRRLGRHVARGRDDRGRARLRPGPRAGRAARARRLAPRGRRRRDRAPLVPRAVSAAPFSVLLALLPASAAVVGAVVLHRVPPLPEAAGLLLVSGATAMTAAPRDRPQEGAPPGDAPPDPPRA